MIKTLISIVGPTAIGKTTLAILLAKHFNTEIVSADSRQFYKEMCIGTAVPTSSELQSVRHHFIQHKSVLETYSVGAFEKDALQLLDSLFKNKDIVILVGGSGLYVNAVTKGLDNFPKIDSEIRASLNNRLQENGLLQLQTQLKELDPIYYEKVDLENPHRVIRALEICIGSGKPYSSYIGQEKPKRPFNTITLGIDADRKIIYNRINKRVDIMLEQGLINEVKSLSKYKHLNALNTVGYKEIFTHLKGETDFDFSISEIKKNTRRFAKRQLTWFKKNKETIWVNYEYEVERVIERINSYLK